MKNNTNKDIELHDLKYENLISKDPEEIFKPRIEILSHFQKKIKKINGNVLDIGAGSGYASIWLAKNSNANKIICLENSKFAVDRLIPKNIKYHKVEDKIDVQLGSFEDLQFNDNFDFIISFGSIHHASCLFTCMNSLYKALKNNGYLIMSEPSMDNSTSNEDYIKKYNTEEIFEGIKIKNYERNDRFFREAEYITSAVYSGFDLKLKSYENKNYSNVSSKVKIIKNLLMKKEILKLITLIFSYPLKFFKFKILNTKKENSKSIVKPTIFFFQKNITSYIPHVWNKLK